MDDVQVMIGVALCPAMPSQTANASISGLHELDDLGVNWEAERLEAELAILKKSFTLALVLELDI